MSNQKFLITTTSSIDGVSIKKYNGIISARIVTGTDFFSDLFAGFSDFFGGRSATYQNQLKDIYDEVIDLLKKEAKRVGANVILGLRIDHDEISGKGKQMFMVTAIGTAAIIDNYPIESDSGLGEITLHNFELELKKQRIIHHLNRAAEESFLLSNLEYLTQNRIAEVVDHVFKYGVSDPLYNKQIMKYFSDIDEESSKEYLYAKLLKNDVCSYAIKLIKECYLLDFNKILEFLNSNDFQAKKSALQLLSGRKRYYNRNDVDLLEEMKEVISTSIEFSNRGHVIGDKWECECGKSNKMAQVYCKSCEKDIKGFAAQEINVETAIAHIAETQFVLKHIFNIK
jgi:uncharacterized protein YbjQ (UPF0145 family)